MWSKSFHISCPISIWIGNQSRFSFRSGILYAVRLWVWKIANNLYHLLQMFFWWIKRILWHLDHCICDVRSGSKHDVKQGCDNRLITTAKRRILFSLIRSWYIASRKRYRCLFAILLTEMLDHFGSIFGLIKDKRTLSTIPCYSHTKIFFGFAKISRFPFLHELFLVREYLQLVAAQEKSIVNINDYQNNILAYEFNIYTRIRSAFLKSKSTRLLWSSLFHWKAACLRP